MKGKNIMKKTLRNEIREQEAINFIDGAINRDKKRLATILQSGLNINPLYNPELRELNNRITFYIKRYTEIVRAVCCETVLENGYENIHSDQPYFKDSFEIARKF